MRNRALSVVAIALVLLGASCGDDDSTEGLAISNDTGLLGVPLPEGATLLESTPADPATSRDPSEKYEIQADVSTIGAFFDRHMEKSGWKKTRDSTDTALFYEKDDLLIGVLMNRSGGSFTLLGS